MCWHRRQEEAGPLGRARQGQARDCGGRHPRMRGGSGSGCRRGRGGHSARRQFQQQLQRAIESCWGSAAPASMQQHTFWHAAPKAPAPQGEPGRQLPLDHLREHSQQRLHLDRRAASAWRQGCRAGGHADRGLHRSGRSGAAGTAGAAGGLPLALRRERSAGVRAGGRAPAAVRLRQAAGAAAPGRSAGEVRLGRWPELPGSPGPPAVRQDLGAGPGHPGRAGAGARPPRRGALHLRCRGFRQVLRRLQPRGAGEAGVLRGAAAPGLL
mmetsp:Transcript_58642/g.188587  ORF Transcript_58642/g.188587 Transcript_58642/m.188587 type:complete len:268 (+) Transcript_58642:1144-1947(+)